MFHRFYTLDKKPTVWHIAVLTVFMIIGMAVILTRQAISIPWFLAVYIVFHLAVLGMLISIVFGTPVGSTIVMADLGCFAICFVIGLVTGK